MKTIMKNKFYSFSNFLRLNNASELFSSEVWEGHVVCLSVSLWTLVGVKCRDLNSAFWEGIAKYVMNPWQEGK